jgi:hypothetical protein
VTGRRRKRRKELLDDLKEKSGYWKLKRGSTRSHSVDDTLCQTLWSTRKTRLRNMNDHQQDRGVEGKITLKRTSRKRWFKGVQCTELAQNKIPMEGFRRNTDKASGPTTMSIYDFWDMTPYSLVDWYQHLGGTCCLSFLCRSVS